MLSDLRTYLLADSTLSGLIGSRFYFERIPPNEPFPHCSFGVIDEDVTNTHGADTSELNLDTIQIDVYTSTTGADAIAIKDAIKDRINSGSFTQGSTRFGYIEWDSAFSGFDPQTETFSQTITLTVVWSPAS